MSYLMQAELAGDQNIQARVTACAAAEGVVNPSGWAFAHAWQLSAEPGWSAAYASAKALYDEQAEGENIPVPGANEGAITDADLLSAVQKILADEGELN